MTGSSDLFNHDGRAPRASINHVTVHDGFTLQDLFSYNTKHNEANGEDNRDGANENHSNNCGHEGPTDDGPINALRNQLRRNQLACLLLAQGVALILAGDEVANTQNGNNNAYCQDNEIGWVGWEGLGRDGDEGSGLEISRRPLSGLCAGTRRKGAARAFHCAQCRPRSDCVQAAEAAGIQELAATIEHGRR
jgi:pullulanase/glycogen debranching enzyme